MSQEVELKSKTGESKTQGENWKRTLESALSLLGIGIIDFCVFKFLPQYTTWAVVGTAALLALYHPWWQHKPKPAKLFVEIEEEREKEETQPSPKGNLVWVLVGLVGFCILFIIAVIFAYVAK